MEYDSNDYQGRKKQQVEYSYKVVTFCYTILVLGTIGYAIYLQFA
jgi:preprotein translocase subunit Sss1